MENLIKKLNKVEEGLVGMALLGLAILTFVETALRYTVSYTFTWFGEFANYMMIFCTYLGAAIGVKYGTHFSMEALTEYCPDKVSHLLKTTAYFISGSSVYFSFIMVLSTFSSCNCSEQRALLCSCECSFPISLSSLFPLLWYSGFCTFL